MSIPALIESATRRFFTQALDHGSHPSAVTTDKAPAYPRVVDKLVPAACHLTEQYDNNLIEADHGRLKARLRPMRGLKQLRCVQVISAGHAFANSSRSLSVNATVPERAMKKFTSPRHAQRFLSAFSGISPHFRPRRHRLSAEHYRREMTDRFTTWNQVTGTATAA